MPPDPPPTGDADTSARRSLVPSSIAPAEAPARASDPAAAPAERPAGPAVTPLAVQLVDRVGDLVGVIVIGHLCALGKIGGVEACVFIGAVLGVGTGLRQAGARAGTAAGVGLTGLALLSAAQLAPYGVALAGGFARWRGLAALVLGAALLAGPVGCATTGARAGQPTVQERAAATATTVLHGAALVRRLLCAEGLAPVGDPSGPAAAARRVLCDPALGLLLEAAPLLLPAPSSGGDAPSPSPPGPRVEADAGGVPDDAATLAGEGR